MRDNAESIKRIPCALISDEARAAYLARAAAGEDVYAYVAAGDGSDPVWNLWDWDTRIVLAPIATAHEILAYERLDGDRWRFVLKRPDTGQLVEVTFHVQIPFCPLCRPLTSDDAAYLARVLRVAQSAIAHCDRFRMPIDALEGTYQTS